MPFALILIGVFLFLTGAAGGWQSLSLEINAVGWQIAVAALGILIISIGGILLWSERATSNYRQVASNKYGIRITSPDNDTKVPTVPYSFTISGSYKKSFPDKLALQIFVLHGSEYWTAPKPEELQVKRDTWSTEVYIGGKPGPRIIIVALVKPTIQDLCRNYWINGNKKNVWQSIKAPNDDIIECDRVIVNKSE